MAINACRRSRRAYFDPMETLTVDLPDEAATFGLGVRLAPLLLAGDAVCLSGPLGAGKTTLARGIIAALTGETEAPSPTFALVESYDAAAISIYHFDLYRLKEPAEIYELGIEEAFDNGVSLIEWPEMIENLIPDNALIIRLEASGAVRRAAIVPRGRWLGQSRAREGLHRVADVTSLAKDLTARESTKRAT